ncbi:MAG: protein kinase [Chloroflexi bacterium]|nr:protein kinase [Chloroflexota bacterium]
MSKPTRATFGDWIAVREVGQGAAGQVWAVRRHGTNATLKASFADSDPARVSLAREAFVLAKLNHPSIPRVLEWNADAGILVMTPEPSETYGDLLRAARLWDIPLGKRLADLRAIAETLDVLHAQGVIHGDLKPAHVTTADPPVLIDFGVARSAGAPNPPEPDAGTAAYLPPPEIPLGPERDNYGFAITAYEILFGAHPILRAKDRQIDPLDLRKRAGDRLVAGDWRRLSRVPTRELPPNLRAADLVGLDDLFTAAFTNFGAVGTTLADWMLAISACIPESLESNAPDAQPDTFGATHTAQEVGALYDTNVGAGRTRSIPVWLIAVLIIAAVIAILVLTRPA